MTIENVSPLASLGWESSWATAFAVGVDTLGIREAGSVVPARVIAEHRERYVVVGEDGEHSAVLAGRARHTADAREQLPAVGDWVGVSHGSGDGTRVVRFVVPRRGAFIRKTAGEATSAQVVAANVDVALIAAALSGELSSRRLERYLALAWESGAMPIVVLTKSDLGHDIASALAAASLAAPAVPVLAVSAVTGEGIEALATHLLPGQTAVLLGSSGVGKSTLVNRLLGSAHQRTAEVGDDGRGRHTTTHRELVRLANGALLIDTPGMRELQLWTAHAGLDAAFADIEGLAEACRFRDCEHEAEPDCAVLAAVARGALPIDRLESWHRLRRELAYLARKQDERATAEARGRIKSLTRGLRSHLRDKYGGA